MTDLSHPDTESARPGDAADRFPRNCWYVVARSVEVKHEILKRTVARENIVMYRTSTGRVVVLPDMCPHRLAPFSKGQLVGDAIQCNYHGIQFDPDGKCIRIPGEEKIAAGFCVKSHPVVEKWGFVWAWLGEASLADESLMPQPFKYQSEPGWCPLDDYIHVKSNYRLVIDNLLDLSHEAFLHAGTIGNAAVADTPAKTLISGERIEVMRFMQDCPPPRLFIRAANFTGNIDRHQKITFVPPCYVIIEVWAVPTGTTDKSRGLSWWVLNALTPEDERNTHYFWGLPRGFKLGDTEITEMLRAGVTRTFQEDCVMLEGQQINIDRVPLEHRTLYTRADQAPARARGIIASMVEREAAASGRRI